jgi:hypothetical protein
MRLDLSGIAAIPRDLIASLIAFFGIDLLVIPVSQWLQKYFYPFVPYISLKSDSGS